MMDNHSMQQYYRQPGPMTDPKEYAPLLSVLPADITELVHSLQNLLTHIFWAQRYGIEHPAERQAEVQLRRTSEKLARLIELDRRPLHEPRPLEKRLVSNCRDFSVVLTAVLRAQGVPARARCGFGTYFTPGQWEDHWVCEYWHDGEQRWVMVDAQLDEIQRSALKISFDPLDMPPGRFVLAGEAWQMCRRGDADPDKFGIFQWHGWDFIRGNVMREVLSLNRIEVLPWDQWGILETPLADSPPAIWSLVDRAAELTIRVDECFDDLRRFYAGEPGLQAPPDWL